jgi:hypothetical protein
MGIRRPRDSGTHSRADAGLGERSAQARRDFVRINRITLYAERGKFITADAGEKIGVLTALGCTKMRAGDKASTLPEIHLSTILVWHSL